MNVYSVLIACDELADRNHCSLSQVGRDRVKVETYRQNRIHPHPNLLTSRGEGTVRSIILRFLSI